MILELLSNRLPEFRGSEDCIQLRRYPGIPDGDYTVYELYCTEPNCDCRQVRLVVADGRRVYASIHYGWERRDYYRRFWKSLEPDAKMLDELQGPSLARLAPQSEYADKFLEVIKLTLRLDPSFHQRFKEHYTRFRESVDRMATTKPRIAGRKLGRNSLCECGSKKKFKHCCGKREAASA